MKVNPSTTLRINSEQSRTVNLLGVKIDDVSIPEIADIVKEWLSKPGKYYIITPNPEIVVMAQKDLELKKIINEADLAIPDGRGLKLSGDIVCNSPGIDVLEALVKLAADLAVTVGFLGGEEGVAKKTAECLQKKYKNLKVIFAESGGEIDNNGNVIARNKVTKQSSQEIATPFGLAMTKTDLLFVAFGPPKQEKWIAKNLDKLPIKVAMGVGGSFDYISGKTYRAPVLIRKLGFEWLFRLVLQPWRIKRQLALLEYIWLLTRSKLKV